jgi:TRAP-type C4-dicarboxylate transport system permease small subunit
VTGGAIHEAVPGQEFRSIGRARRHLKWRALDRLERALIVVCALLLVGVTGCEIADVVCRNLGRPWLEANEFATGFFVWGVFLGMSVAVRRDQHFRLTSIAEAQVGMRRTFLETFNRVVVLAVGVTMVGFGYLNTLNGFGSFLMPSVTPIAVLYAAIPVSGALIVLFTVEELANGFRHGFVEPRP